MSTNTTNYNFVLPAVNSAVDEDLWGDELNANFTSLDTILKAVSDVANAALAASQTAVFTGALMAGLPAATPSGWVLASGIKTIGSAASGATERANADTEALFTLIWNDYSNALYPIQDSSGGATTRGASAAADFAANKRLPTADVRGRVLAGKDNMGGTAANRLTAASAAGLDGSTLGASGGVQEHALTIAQMPAHTHTVPFTGPVVNISVAGALGGVSSATTTTSSAGSNAAHTNVQPTLVTNIFIKL